MLSQIVPGAAGGGIAGDITPGLTGGGTAGGAGGGDATVIVGSCATSLIYCMATFAKKCPDHGCDKGHVVNGDAPFLRTPILVDVNSPCSVYWVPTVG